MPISSIGLDEILAKIMYTAKSGKHYAVVAKRSSRRDAENVYATTLLEYTPGPQSAPIELFRAVHSQPLRWTLKKIAEQSNGHVVALQDSEQFVPKNS